MSFMILAFWKHNLEYQEFIAILSDIVSLRPFWVTRIPASKQPKAKVSAKVLTQGLFSWITD